MLTTDYLRIEGGNQIRRTELFKSFKIRVTYNFELEYYTKSTAVYTRENILLLNTNQQQPRSTIHFHLTALL